MASNAKLIFREDGSEYITFRISEARRQGQSLVVLEGNYEISTTVILPSHITLLLRDCHLRMADNTFCRMFQNEHLENPDIRDEDISILGEGKAILDGGNYNLLSERNSEKDGRPHISANNLVLFSGVDHFSVGNLEARNQRWWALNFIACTDGHLYNLNFDSDATRIDKDTGERVFGLKADDYEGIYIKNSDGIDLRAGCRNILIENITGFTEDDTVALTALSGSVEALYPHPGIGDNAIENVIIRNVRSSAYCTNVRLLNQGGTNLRNILVDGVFDTSRGDPRLDRGLFAVRLGDDHMYGIRPGTPEETQNIVIRNVYSRGQAAVCLRGSTKNVITENIFAFDGCDVTLDDRRTEK